MRELATQSMLGAFMRMAMLKDGVGSGSEIVRIAVVTQSVTVLEQFLRLILELDIDEKARGKGRVVIKSIEGIEAAIAMSEARFKSSMSGFQSEAAVRRMAAERGMPALLEFIEEYAEELRYLFRKRHALTHSVGIVEFNEARAFAVVERLVHAVLAARPQYMMALLLVEGHVMSQAGRRAAARRAYERVVELCGRAGAAGGKEERVQACMGHALARLGRAGEAEACYARALRINPGYALASLEMGHLKMRAGRPGEALGMYKRSAEADPGYVPARVARGHALGLVRSRGVGGDVLEVECYDNALRIDSEEMSAHTGCGLALAADGRHADAIEWYRRAVKADPGDAAGRTGLANSLAAIGNDAEAITEYGAAIKIFGRTGAAMRRAPAGRGGRGAMTARIARSLGAGAACVGLGNALLGAGQAGGAADAFRRAAKLDGGSARAWIGLGEALLGSGQAGGAADAFRRAAERDGGSAQAWSGLARSLAVAGKDEEAGRARNKAAEIQGTRDIHRR